MLLSVAPLLENDTVKKLMAIYDGHGYQIRLIGGCVRDVLVGRPVVDLDLATTATPEQGQRLLEKENIKALPTGIKHGTLTILLDGQSFEVTTLRRDIDTDGRHAQVMYTDSWQDDAARRDLTINALSVDLSGKLYDYWDGQADLKQKRLRFIGDARTRIREDYLRILRFFRLASVLDWPCDDNDARDACCEMVSGLKHLSRERIQNELYKLLLGDGCLRVLAEMIACGVWRALTDQPPHLDMLHALMRLEEEHDKADPLRRLVALGNSLRTAWLEKLVVLTNKDKKRLEALSAMEKNPQAVSVLLYYYGTSLVMDHCLLSGDDKNYTFVQHWQKPLFPVAAADILPYAGGPGPLLGEMLKKAEKWWIERNFKPSREEVLTYIASFTTS